MEDRMDEATGWKIVAKCYKTKVWTDFRVRLGQIRYSSSSIISL